MSVRFRFKINVSYSFLLSIYNLPMPRFILAVEIFDLILETLGLHFLPFPWVRVFHLCVSFILRRSEPCLLLPRPISVGVVLYVMSVLPIT